MHTAFGGILLAFLALLASYFVPWVSQFPVILGINRVWRPDPQFANLQESCTSLYPAELTGCEKFKIVGDSLFAACARDWDVRKKWFPPMREFERFGGAPGVIRDRVYRIDLKTKELTLLAMSNFPDALDFCAHGMDVIEVSPGEFSMFLVNHRRDGSVIENFKYTAGSREIVHVDTFNGTSYGLYNPNDVFAIPVSDASPDSEKAFFATNDHWFKDSAFGRLLELQLRLPTGSVFYHSKSTGFNKVLTGLANANGITGFRDPQNPVLFVAAILDCRITAYNYKPGAILASGGLTKLKDFTLDFVMDNLAISKDSKWLYFAGHGEPQNLPKHWAKPDEISSASMAYRMSLTELGGHFGTRGETGESRVEKIVMDRAGVLGNGSTTAIGDDELNKFWMSGLGFNGILECDLHAAGENAENEEAEEEAEEDYE
ncbi:hypothetical protein DRE_05110 [Drechslerella stenobrocha 248]|uniref:SMP-30/Gluconolactonase/LRE-like region domain-containing protein n=1 Tax=Drechslerella stenobrocha 248 TaxID=1043628 RepID=W7I0M5_9PEZI|nr:hypothetical protein DRE_05110 [Drechslerella stenobrocha 248]